MARKRKRQYIKRGIKSGTTAKACKAYNHEYYMKVTKPKRRRGK